MKIGVWLNNDMLPIEGGAYTYIHSLVKLLDNELFENADIVFLTYRKNGKINNLKKQIIYLNDSYTAATFFFKFVRKLFRNNKSINHFFTKKINNEIASIVKNEGIDYIYYLNQAQKEVETFPFIATNWDIAHLSLKIYSEFNENGQLEKRERWYESELKKAIVIAVESQAGKNELINYLNIAESKIVIVPFFIKKNNRPYPDLEQVTLKKYGLVKEYYFYYPAQYWRHKNHSTLIKAFKLFRQVQPEIKLVFSGSDKGELTFIKEEIAQLQLTDCIVCLNFIPEIEKELLLLNSLSLVMPTFLGPTNLPPLEAFEYGIPCACSDLKGHREMLGDSALYFDPHSPIEIYNMLCRINDPEERKKLNENSKIVKRNSIFNYISTKKALDNLFLTLKNNQY